MNHKEVKQLRKELQLTQEQFAKQLNMTKSHLSMIENGKRNLSEKLTTKIREVFHLSGGILPMEAKIDFLRVRFKYHYPLDIIEKVLRMSSDHFLHEDRGFYHYSAMYHFSEIFVYYHPQNIDMGVMIELRGQGCREYELVMEEQGECWTTFFWRLYQDDLLEENVTVDTKITRIDVALDEHFSAIYPNYDLHQLKEKWEQGLVETTFRNFEFRGGGLQTKQERVNKGLSLYFGSRQSPYYFNFYEKDFELAKKEQISVEMAREKYGIKNRYEVRLANEKAYLFVEYLLSTGETLEWVVKELIDTSLKVYDCDEEGFKIGYDEAWRTVIESMQELRLSMKGEKPSYERALRWLSNYLAPTLKKIWIIDQTLGKNELMERIEKAELKEKDEEDIQKVTTSIKELLVQDNFEEDSELVEMRQQMIVKEEEIEQLLAQYLFE